MRLYALCAVLMIVLLIGLGYGIAPQKPASESTDGGWLLVQSSPLPPPPPCYPECPEPPAISTLQ